MNLSLAEIALATSLLTQAQSTIPPEELLCLSHNVYHEARGEKEEGQVAVAFLTLNRVKSERYPSSVCDVVMEDRGSKSYDCQFSWYCDGKSDEPLNTKAYYKAMKISLKAMTGDIDNPIKDATHYYAYGIKTPVWASKLTKVAVIGGHRFMKVK